LTFNKVSSSFENSSMQPLRNWSGVGFDEFSLNLTVLEKSEREKGRRRGRREAREGRKKREEGGGRIKDGWRMEDGG
jgi:hypothetical protein